MKPLVAAATLAASTAGVFGQWTFTVLYPGDAVIHSEATCVSGNRQGGYYDNGYSFPMVWNNTAASGNTLVQPSADAGSQVLGISDTQAVGQGYVRLSPTSGYYAAMLWDATGTQLSYLNPSGATWASAYGVSGGTQAGDVQMGDTAPHLPSLWHGTAASWVNLLPNGYTGGTCYATDGVQQAGVVFDANSNSIASLWSGTPESWVSLHPTGTVWQYSEASATGNGQQAGYVSNATDTHAALWSGTAASFVDLHPAGLRRSSAGGVSNGRVCGYTRAMVGPRHAAYWAGNAASYFDLHSVLTPNYTNSNANGIWSDGQGTIRVVGYAYNSTGGSTDALMWTLTVASGACCTGTACSVTTATACSGQFQGLDTACGPTGNPTYCCPANFNQQNGVNVQDIFDFLAAWFAGDPRADFNHSGAINIQDIFDFLAAWFAGC